METSTERTRELCGEGGEREVGEGMSDGEGGGRRKKVMMADHRRFCSACE